MVSSDLLVNFWSILRRITGEKFHIDQSSSEINSILLLLWISSPRMIILKFSWHHVYCLARLVTKTRSNTVVCLSSMRLLQISWDRQTDTCRVRSTGEGELERPLIFYWKIWSPSSVLLVRYCLGVLLRTCNVRQKGKAVSESLRQLWLPTSWALTTSFRCSCQNWQWYDETRVACDGSEQDSFLPGASWTEHKMGRGKELR